MPHPTLVTKGLQWGRWRSQGREQEIQLRRGKGDSTQLQTPMALSQPYLGSSQGHRRTQTPPFRTQGSGHLARREQNKGTISIHTSSSSQSPQTRLQTGLRLGAARGYPCMGQCILAPKTILRQPLCINNGFGNKRDDGATTSQAAPHPADGAGVPCFGGGGSGMGAQLSP